MSLSAGTLSVQLQTMTPTADESSAIEAFTNAWAMYFAAADAGGVPYDAGPTPASAMAAAMIGLSTAGQAAAKIQAGVVAWWGALSASPGTYFEDATSITAPASLANIASALSGVFAANLAGNLSLADASTAVANALHTNNLGGASDLGGID